MNVYSYLAIATYQAYGLTLCGNPSENNKKLHRYMSALAIGSLVMEITTIWHRERDEKRFGYLISDSYELLHSDEEWEIVRHEYDVSPRPTHRVVRIRLLSDDTEFAWHNCEFVRVLDWLW